MESKRIFLSPPHMGGNELKYIQEAFDSNWISSVGANIDSFELAIENYIGFGNAVALNSGTSAIHLGLILLGVQTGDVVICQSMTFSASVNPILYLGATPIFVDSEEDTWGICPNALEEAIVAAIQLGKKPKAIIAVHLYGTPYKVDEVRTIAENYQIPILEDAAEALGSTYKGQACGRLGDVGVFSFNGSKIITASAGGALIVKTKELKQKAIFLATQAKEDLPYYQHNQIGYNYRMSNICAGIGRGQMEVLATHLALRKEVHDFYHKLFEAIEGITLFKVPNNDFVSNYWLNTIIVEPNDDKKIDREKLRLAFEKANIETRPLWKPMHLQPVFEKFPYYGSSIAENLFNKGLCLPSGSNLSIEDKNCIKKLTFELFKSSIK